MKVLTIAKPCITGIGVEIYGIAIVNGDEDLLFLQKQATQLGYGCYLTTPDSLRDLKQCVAGDLATEIMQKEDEEKGK